MKYLGDLGLSKLITLIKNKFDSLTASDIGAIADTAGSVTSNHLADSSVTNVKIANGAVSNGKIANSTITRAKLANDVLYSPITGIAAGGNIEITSEHIGKTIKTSWNAEATITITQANSQNMPTGTELAIFRWGNSAGGACKIVASGGIRMALSGEEVTYKNCTVKISDTYSMIALKKVEANSSAGDVWLVTGNVEVVS